MNVTAKVQLQQKSNFGPNESQLVFVPDYADGRNKEWANATPSLSLSMTVKNSVAKSFNPGERYTLTFEKTEDVDEPAAEDTEVKK